MRPIIVAGIGTDVGKTLVSAILTEAIQADYWKPIQSGNLEDSDTQQVQRLISNQQSRFFASAYHLSHSLSPHHAARLENVEINMSTIKKPHTKKPLIIECAGGLLTPLTHSQLQAEFYAQWDCDWILVSRHYLGSINHTLLSLEYLKRINVKLLGIVFNGAENPDTENVIMKYIQKAFVFRLNQEEKWDRNTIKRYVDIWSLQLNH